MKIKVFAIVTAFMVFACCLLGSEHQATTSMSSERPTVNVPVALRQANWLGSKREGCCTLASLCTALNWCGCYKDAAYVRSHFGNGQSPQSLAQLMASANIRFAWTVGDKDVDFLEQALAGRRAVMVAVFADPVSGDCHMLNLTQLDATSACLIDNNSPRDNKWMSREQFLKTWFETGSWAVVPLEGAPAPPLITQ